MLNMNSSRLPRMAQITFLLLASTALPALALDGDDFATKLNAAYTSQGGKISFSAIEVDGDDITLTDASVETPGEETIEIGDLVFEDVGETDDGGYIAGLMKIADIDVTKDDTRVQATDIQLKGFKIPADPDAKGVNGILFYDGISVGPTTISNKGAEVFGLDGIQGDVTNPGSDEKIGFSFAVNGMVIDVTAIEDPKARKALSDLGYDELTGSAKAQGSWEPENGRVNVPEYSLSFDNVGKLALALDFSGYTTEFMKAMQQAQNADQKAKGMMMMGMMQQLTLTSAEIHFEDASLTGRLLEYAGKQQGVSGEQMAQAAKGMLPLVIGQLGVPALQSQIIAAANIYLDNPENLNVSVVPNQPVPFMQIMGAGMTDPRQLADMLNVKITANK